MVNDCHPFEQFLLTSAKAFVDGEVCFVGFHWPMVAARIARQLHAPELVVIYEGGVVEDRLAPELSTSPSDLRAAVGSAAVSGAIDALYGYLGSGRVTRTVLEAPIVDRRGNVNTSVVGSYDRPKVRLPGSGGGTELGSMGKGLTLLCASTAPRSFPVAVDYITSPGYLTAPGHRARLGYHADRGPKLLVTPLGRFSVDDLSGIQVELLHDGVEWADVRTTFAWLPRDAPPDVGRIPRPTPDELAVVRGVLDEARTMRYRLPEGLSV
jgi:acyl CoA:acetate/3-ketoacid CoA transferase beta subunit